MKTVFWDTVSLEQSKLKDILFGKTVFEDTAKDIYMVVALASLVLDVWRGAGHEKSKKLKDIFIAKMLLEDTAKDIYTIIRGKTIQT